MDLRELHEGLRLRTLEFCVEDSAGRNKMSGDLEINATGKNKQGMQADTNKNKGAHRFRTC